MFQIKSYLQYRNTPSSKPRVLTEGVDYNFIGLNHLVQFLRFDGIEIKDNNDITFKSASKLTDCRPLLTVENIRQEIFTECDVFHLRYRLKKKWVDQYSIIFFNGFFMDEISFLFDKDYIRRDYSTYVEAANLDIIPEKFYGKGAHKKKIGSFFDNPTHYSKLLWGCSEEEGLKELMVVLQLQMN